MSNPQFDIVSNTWFMQSIITCVLCYAEDSRAKLNLWKLGEIIRSAAVGYTKNVIYFCVYSGGDCSFPSSSFFLAPLAHALTITFERLRFAHHGLDDILAHQPILSLSLFPLIFPLFWKPAAVKTNKDWAGAEGAENWGFPYRECDF